MHIKPSPHKDHIKTAEAAEASVGHTMSLSSGGRFHRGGRSCRDRRQVFQTSPPRTSPTLLEVRDALDTASSIHSLQDRMAYCHTLGIDYAQARDYYDSVVRLERSYNSCSVQSQPVVPQKPFLVQVPPPPRRIRTIRYGFTFWWHVASFLWHVCMS